MNSLQKDTYEMNLCVYDYPLRARELGNSLLNQEPHQEHLIFSSVCSCSVLVIYALTSDRHARPYGTSTEPVSVLRI